jgi:hypothetical protein
MSNPSTDRVRDNACAMAVIVTSCFISKKLTATSLCRGTQPSVPETPAHCLQDTLFFAYEDHYFCFAKRR